LWLSPEHHLCSWVLSVQTARQHFSSTALFTDKAGAHLLVDQLGLEFDEVSTELDALARYDAKCWALGKVWTYRAQTEPFVHVDSDAFLWKPLPKSLTSAAVLAQFPDEFILGASYYQPEEFEQSLCAAGEIWLPAEWVWYRSSKKAQRGDSCGIFGGNRIDFIQHYANQGIRLIEHPDNRKGLPMLAAKTERNLLFEQYLLAACIDYHRQHRDSPFHDIEISYLFDSLNSAFDEDQAQQVGYTHLVASAKRNPDLALRLESRVKRDYPDYYERCLNPPARTRGSKKIVRRRSSLSSAGFPIPQR
jgi:hypothetical protein